MAKWLGLRAAAIATDGTTPRARVAYGSGHPVVIFGDGGEGGQYAFGLAMATGARSLLTCLT